MMIRIACLLAALLSASAFAQSDTATEPAPDSDARAVLDRFAAGLETLSGRFTQITIDVDGVILEESVGELYFSAPDRFRWSYEDPFPQELVADGERLWHYDAALEQVTVRDQPAPGESPLLVLLRPDLLDRFYQVRASLEPGVIEFVPSSDEAEFEQARLVFVEQQPAYLEINDTFGQLTRLVLEDLVRNPALDAELFRFEPPAGADVLEGY